MGEPIMKTLTTVIRVLFLILFLFLVWQGKMMLWLALFGVSLGLALLFGRVYCGYMCPMHALMIPTEKLGKKLKWQTSVHPKWLDSGVYSWIALVASVVMMLLARKVLKTNLPILLIWLVASVLVTLRYKQAVFHNLICPFGALQRVFGKAAIFSHWVNKTQCIGCKRCEKVCPAEAIVVGEDDRKATISRRLCLQCNACQQVCPTDAIPYTRVSTSNTTNQHDLESA